MLKSISSFIGSKRFYITLSILAICIGGLYILLRKLKYDTPSQVVNNIAISEKGMNKAKLIYDSIISLPLDSNTTPESIQYIQYFEDSNKKYLSLLNIAFNDIYLYDLSVKEIVRKISLLDYGFSQQSKIQGFYFINLDSLLIYSSLDTRLTLLDLTKGKVLQRSFSTITDANTAHPFISARTPILYDGKLRKVFLPGFPSDEGGTLEVDKQRQVLTSFNIASGEAKFDIKYPSFYWGKNWGGGGGFRQVFMDINPNNQELIISFMADHQIVRYNYSTEEYKANYCGSRNIENIKSMKYSPNYFDFINSFDIYKYYLRTPSYSVVKYEPSCQLYFRIAELPLSKITDDSPSLLKKKKNIIVLNKDFEKILETSLPDTLNPNMMFTNRNGVYIEATSKTDNNRISFYLFHITI